MFRRWLREGLLGAGLVGVSLVSLGPVQFTGALAANSDNRPFWTERSTWNFGGDLFVVGVASRAKTTEEGRQLAFEHGKRELLNFTQAVSLDGITIDTQMTYEEPNEDGSVTVFRLLRVPVPKLSALKSAPQYSFSPPAPKQPTVKTPTKPYRATPDIPDDCLAWTPGTGQPPVPLNHMEQLGCYWQKRIATWGDEREARRAAEERRLAETNPEEYARRKAIQQAKARILAEREETRRICGQLVVGMTKEEIRAVLGEPAKSRPLGDVEYLYYGSGGQFKAELRDGKLFGKADCVYIYMPVAP